MKINRCLKFRRTYFLKNLHISIFLNLNLTCTPKVVDHKYELRSKEL